MLGFTSSLMIEAGLLARDMLQPLSALCPLRFFYGALQDSPGHDTIASRNIALNCALRKWWNWQTHHLEGVAPKGVGVQIPPSAPRLSALEKEIESGLMASAC